MDMSEIRSEELAVPQLAMELIYAIEALEECKGKVLEARFRDVDEEAEEEVAELPVVNLRSFLAETLKPKGHTLGHDELSLEIKSEPPERVLFRFCREGHVHLSTTDEALLEKTLEQWRKGGFKLYTRVDEEWVSRL
jgi:hypothetical protein